jgi:hypothetical protein
MPLPQPLTRHLQTTVFSVEDLLDRVRRGEIRIPPFQRPFQWKTKDISDLLDSVYRGYPIGTLLFWRREAPAARVYFGPVAIDAPQTAQALWVVDGSQRVNVLVGVLLHPPYPLGSTPDDFALSFDLQNETLVWPKGGPQPYWLPLNVVADSEQLLEWLDRYPGRHDHPEHVRAAIRFSKAIREYPIPISILETDAVEEVSTAFERLNSKGKSLTQADLARARGAHQDSDTQRLLTVSDLSKRLRTLGFGKIEQKLLRRALFAVIGQDTASQTPELRDIPHREEALAMTERALRGAIIFLKRDVGIPHAELLPYKATLIVLARFFRLHPEPSARSRELLSRWLWRGALTAIHQSLDVDQRYTEEIALRAIMAGEDRSIQKLLTTVPHKVRYAVDVSRRFDFRQGEAKVLANALISLRPHHLRTSLPLDVPVVLDRAGAAALSFLVTSLPDAYGRQRVLNEEAFREWGVGLANIFFHPPLKQEALWKALLVRGAVRERSEVLLSHGIPQEAIEAIAKDDLRGFLETRASFLEEHALRFVSAKARWGESDRGSLQSLIVADEED